MIPLLISDTYPALIAALATITAALALAAPSAFAGDVSLWACHGPNGEPLGSAPFAGTSSGDGVLGTYGTGCGGQVATLGDGGLLAQFGRPDPVQGSTAGWKLSVPAGAALESVTLERATRGFGGVPRAGDPITYEASSSGGSLESASVADQSDVPLSGTASFSTGLGGDLAIGVGCGPVAGGRCAAPSAGTVGVEVAAVRLDVADDSPPHVAVGGVENPAAGLLPLIIRATDAGVGLSRATAVLDGAPGVSVALGGASCTPIPVGSGGVDLPLGADCPASVTDVPLPIDTTGVSDGPHQLTVTVVDAAGNVTTAVSQQITVRNHLMVPGSAVLLSVGSGGELPGASGSNARPKPAPTTVVCASPQLTAALASRPLDVRGRLAVLWAGTRYLFTGRLTCVHDGRRIPAPTDAVVDIRSLVGRRVVPRTGAAVYAHGRFRVLLHPRSTRTIEFRVGIGKTIRSVAIHVIVTPRRTPA